MTWTCPSERVLAEDDSREFVLEWLLASKMTVDSATPKCEGHSNPKPFRSRFPPAADETRFESVSTSAPESVFGRQGGDPEALAMEADRHRGLAALRLPVDSPKRVRA